MPGTFIVKLWARNQRYWLRQIASGEEKAFNRFLESQNWSSIFQSIQWGQFKSLYGWEPIYLLPGGRFWTTASLTFFSFSARA